MTFSIRHILNTSFETYSAYFSRLILAFAIPAVILEVLTFAIEANGADPMATARGLNSVSNLMYLFSTGITYSILSAHQEGVQLSFGQAVKHAFSSFGRLFVVSFMVGLNAFLRALLIIPVIVLWFTAGCLSEPLGIVSIGIFCLIPIALIPSLRYSLETSLAVPILFGEGTESSEAIRQSRVRTKGLLGKIVALYAVAIVGLLALVFVSAIVLGVVVASAGSAGGLFEILYAAGIAAVVGPVFPLLLWGTYLEAKGDPRFS